MKAMEQHTMTINLTPEQEHRVQAVIRRGSYESVEEVVEAALAAVEQRTVQGFHGTQEELDTLLADGLASKELTGDQFWGLVNSQTDAMLAEYKSATHS
jgi:Arc/MetJ-type ribon-helix-helix transcriptional regulator